MSLVNLLQNGLCKERARYDHSANRGATRTQFAKRFSRKFKKNKFWHVNHRARKSPGRPTHLGG